MNKQSIKQAVDDMCCMRDMVSHPDNLQFIDKSITSLRQAIAEAEKQEQGKPVAEVTSETGAEITMSWWHEPALPIGTKLYTTPQQRTWVGLTEEDLKLLSAEWRIVYGAWMDDFAKDIEAKLKEKNHV
jgi:hypothetical protein